MSQLTAEEIYSIPAVDYDGSYWVTVDFKGNHLKCEGVSRCVDETSEEMREAGYIYIENGYQWGKEIWISADDIQ